MIIKGILARDNTGWQEDFAEEVAKNGFGVMWKDQFSDIDEVVPLLNNLITEKGFFNYYNIANNVTNYRMKIVDFATKDTYDAKKKEWKQKNPAWFFDTFDEYSDGKQNAKIAFLVESVEKIESEKSISIEDFKTYKDKQASRKNAVAYTKIITIKEINMKQTIETLTTNYNLILTGAPGTGKTYLAKQIAQQMIFGEIKEKMTDEERKQFDEQCDFVQFHPSYDSTDFVECLRPVQDEAGNVGFERKDGVFKAFCKKAVSLPKNDTIDNFNETWDKLVATLNENNYIDVPFLSNKSKSFRVELNEYGTGLANRTYPNNTYEQGGWISGQSKFFSKDQLYNIYRGLSGVPSGGHDNYRRAIVEEMKKSLGLKPYKEGNSVEKSDKNFVFIIDEINRGEISKIFGELFFSIDPGYRGKEKGKIKTQYQNLIEQGDVFYDGFYVPENVYIIGTMNDIDRSVESMDFAFRRRFAFKEIKAIDRVEMLYDSNNGIENYADKAKERMSRLNEEIERIEGLSTAYHIGPAYFLKLKNYDGSFQDLWDNHLEGLLKEYMRGMQGVEDKIKTLKEVYNNPKATNTGDADENL